MSGDYLKNLPTNKEPLPSNDVTLINNLIKNESDVKSVFYECRFIIIAGLLFIIFINDKTQQLLNSLCPVTATSCVINTIIKTIVFMIALYIITNWKLI
jgi:hypothetical protein